VVCVTCPDIRVPIIAVWNVITLPMKLPHHTCSRDAGTCGGGCGSRAGTLPSPLWWD
jgi:hypothetical protein